MRKTFLIAQREYLAFVRTVGFWLSLFTAPLIIAAVIAVPVMLRATSPEKTLPVAVLDLSKTGQGAELSQLIGQAAHSSDHHLPPFIRNASLRQAPLPTGLRPDMTADEATQALKSLESTKTAKDTANVVVVSEDAAGLHFRIWSGDDQEEDVSDGLRDAFNLMAAEKSGAAQGLTPAVVRDIRSAHADVGNLLAQTEADKTQRFHRTVQKYGPNVVGALIGYLSWMTIFSSSMILLGGVIEEKSSKVLEVLLASTSTESLLIGKVLGVAAVMLTVGCIWALAAGAAMSFGASFLPQDILQQVTATLSGLFTPQHAALLGIYFVGGYLMYGVSFSAIGAFCETQKDAQAIMGPMMIVLMIPMMCMQAAFTAPGSPIITWLSYVPLFTPFLMPLRLAHPLQWWEIALSLGGMAVVGGFMIMVGRRAFRQGALTGGKLTWGTLFQLAVKKPVS